MRYGAFGAYPVRGSGVAYRANIADAYRARSYNTAVRRQTYRYSKVSALPG